MRQVRMVGFGQQLIAIISDGKKYRHGRRIDLAKCLVHKSLKRKGANDFQLSNISVVER
jgi:hypothetical protein